MLEGAVHGKWNIRVEGGADGLEVASDLYELCALAARNASMIHLDFDYMMGTLELGELRPGEYCTTHCSHACPLASKREAYCLTPLHMRIRKASRFGLVGFICNGQDVGSGVRVGPSLKLH